MTEKNLATSPSDEQTEQEARDVPVTSALAQTGLLFSMFRNADGGVSWELSFDLKTEPKRMTMQVQRRDPWITVIADAGIGSPEGPLARELLDLNGRLVLARVALDSKKHAIVLTQFPREYLGPALLKQHLQAVLDAVVGVHGLVHDRPPTMVPSS
jgi:hypothetical protein